MSSDIAARRNLQELAHKAATTRSQKGRLEALIGIVPLVESLIQRMTDAEVRLSIQLDGEDITPTRQPDPRPTPPLIAVEHLVVNDEGTYRDVPDEATNYQVPRDVLAAMHTLQSVVAHRGLHMVAAVCGYSTQRRKWTGSVLHHHTAESRPYLIAGVRDSLRSVEQKEATP